MPVFRPGALPPAAVARELLEQLPAHAPTLVGWMQRLSAAVETIDPRATGCTPAEVWELRRAGFVAEPGQRLSAGLGPLRANSSDTNTIADQEPVWIAELVHIALGARQATLAHPAQLVLSHSEDRALYNAALPCLNGSGMTLERLLPGRWRIRLPADLHPPSASPAVVSRGPIDDWWPQNAASRPWRRLLNEIQMVWHDHPVNAARAAQGLLPVNGLWLYGGARPWSVPLVDPTRVLICEALAAPAAAGDWSAWLLALAALERDVLAPLARQTKHQPAPSIVLSGEDRLVTLKPSRNLLPGWFARRTHNWTSWWSPPVSPPVR